MPGAGLTVMSAGQARPDRLALKPYWGKPDVRNFRAMETSASFEARSAPLPYPTHRPTLRLPGVMAERAAPPRPLAEPVRVGGLM
jgi:hypothetical protein